MGQKVLTIKDLQHGYPTRPLFKDVDLDLEKGDRVAIIGPNGAGGGEGREGWEWRTRGAVRVGMEDPGSGKVDLANAGMLSSFILGQPVAPMTSTLHPAAFVLPPSAGTSTLAAFL